MSDESPRESRWIDVQLVTTLFAIAPASLGGLWIRSAATPEREAMLAMIDTQLPSREPRVRLPIGITEDRLLGGISLAATLDEGRLVIERGALARSHGGIVIAATAERMDSLVTAELCAALDRGQLTIERDGHTAAPPCRIGVVALDEGIDDESAPAKLGDRLAFLVDLHGVRLSDHAADVLDDTAIPRARETLSRVTIDHAMVAVLCEAALSLGITSLRAPLLAATCACVHTAWRGCEQVEEADLVVAARLVLGPRAVRIPAAVDDEAPPAPPPSTTSDTSESAASRDNEPPERDLRGDESLAEIVLEAAKTGLPKGLLDALTLGQAPRISSRSSGHAGALRVSSERGRRIGTRAAAPRQSDRINVLETLRAAAPWQAIRRRDRPPSEGRRRLEVRSSDFRINRYVQRTETSVIFAVDASGSAALQRLAEAKGAVELVLSDCYARRDHVALISFRGAIATLLLPPTRSLTRARRCLAELAGGGGTPLAAGLDAALELALDARKRGRSPLVVTMTDGRANVGKEASGVDAFEDALASARALRIAGVRGLLLDTSPRPRAEARRIATEMGARYIPLPFADSSGISAHVRELVGRR